MSKEGTKVRVDFSALTPEEREIILRVLKRDEIIRNVDTKRVKTLRRKSAGADEKKQNKLKIFTGEWIEHFATSGRTLLNSAGMLLRELIDIRITTTSTRDTHTERSTERITTVTTTREGVAISDGSESRGTGDTAEDMGGSALAERRSSVDMEYGRRDDGVIDIAIVTEATGDGRPKVSKVLRKYAKKAPTKGGQTPGPQKQLIGLKNTQIPKEFIFEIDETQPSGKGQVIPVKALLRAIPKEFLFELKEEPKAKGMAKLQKCTPIPQQFVFELDEGFSKGGAKIKSQSAAVKISGEAKGTKSLAVKIPPQFLFEIKEGIGNKPGEKLVKIIGDAKVSDTAIYSEVPKKKTVTIAEDVKVIGTSDSKGVKVVETVKVVDMTPQGGKIIGVKKLDQNPKEVKIVAKEKARDMKVDKHDDEVRHRRRRHHRNHQRQVPKKGGVKVMEESMIAGQKKRSSRHTPESYALKMEEIMKITKQPLKYKSIPKEFLFELTELIPGSSKVPSKKQGMDVIITTCDPNAQPTESEVIIKEVKQPGPQGALQVGTNGKVVIRSPKAGEGTSKAQLGAKVMQNGDDMEVLEEIVIEEVLDQLAPNAEIDFSKFRPKQPAQDQPSKPPQIVVTQGGNVGTTDDVISAMWEMPDVGVKGRKKQVRRG